jgi:uncharacterized low-complexity protein
MTKKELLKPVAIAVGSALAGSMVVSTASADTTPFAMTALSSGYMTADAGEGKCGEGKCGGDKEDAKGEGEGKCGEGKCGGDKAEGEGKCGEGKCGGSV